MSLTPLLVSSTLLLAALTLSAAVHSPTSQPSPPPTPRHRVVLDLSSDGQDPWLAALASISNLRNALGPDNTEIELVARGPGLGLVLKNANPLKSQVEKLLASPGVTFAACRNTMKRRKVTADDLLPGVTPVDAGVAEIVRKQEAGWSYLKVGS